MWSLGGGKRTLTCLIIAFLSGALLLSQSSVVLGSDRICNERDMNIDQPPVALSAYISHAPIVVTSNSDFSTQGFSGSGTKADPYILEGVSIGTTDTCIDIRDTTAYFIIRKCLLNGGASGSGIYLDNVINGVIDQVVIEDKDVGIYIWDSPGISITNSTMSDSNDGIWALTGSDNLVVINNTVSNVRNRAVDMIKAKNATLLKNNLDRGISISGTLLDYWKHNITSDNIANGRPIGYFWNLTGGTIDPSPYSNLILGNCTGVTIRDGNMDGIYRPIQLGFSSHCKILNNTIGCGGTGWAVYLDGSPQNSIVNNTISDMHRGIVIMTDSDSNEIVNNTLSDFSTYGVEVSADNTYIADNYIVAESDITDRSIAAVACIMAYNATFEHNTFLHGGIRIEGISISWWQHKISPDNTVNGQPILYCWGLRDETIDTEGYAQIILGNCSNILIQGGAFTDNSYPIQLGYSDNNTISDITVKDCYVGVVVEASENNTISGMRITDVHHGMNFIYASNNTMSTSRICDVYSYGVEVYNSENLVITDNVLCDARNIFKLFYSSNITISDNYIGNGNIGIDVESSSTNVQIVGNKIVANSVGIKISDSSTDNIVYDNAFAGNTLSAQDDVAGNHWNSTDTGNAWDDYTGSGPYDISGSAGSKDYHPVQLIDDTSPVIDSPEDLTFNVGTTGHSITWNPTEEYPVSYELYINTALSESGYWCGGSFTFNVDDLSVGVYNYTLVVYDAGSNRANDTVFVNVYNDWSAPTIDNPSDINYVVGTTGHTITWSPVDDTPERFDIYRNGSLIESGSWDGSPIVLNVDGLSIGTYNFTLVVFDSLGHWTNDTVFVTVIAGTTTTSTTPTTTEPIPAPSIDIMFVTTLIIAGVVIVIIVIVISRR